MVRSVLGAAATTAVALGALVALGPSAPASAQPDPDPWAGVPYHPEYGSITGASGKLRKGCKTYSVSYVITPPSDGYWAMEYSISGPDGARVAGGGFLDGSDPESGTGTYKLCQPTGKSGTYTIEAKVSVDDGAGHITEGRVADTTYTLIKAKKKHHHHHRPHHRPHHGR